MPLVRAVSPAAFRRPASRWQADRGRAFTIGVPACSLSVCWWASDEARSRTAARAADGLYRSSSDVAWRFRWSHSFQQPCSPRAPDGVCSRRCCERARARGERLRSRSYGRGSRRSLARVGPRGMRGGLRVRRHRVPWFAPALGVCGGVRRVSARRVGGRVALRAGAVAAGLSRRAGHRGGACLVAGVRAPIPPRPEQAAVGAESAARRGHAPQVGVHYPGPRPRRRSVRGCGKRGAAVTPVELAAILAGAVVLASMLSVELGISVALLSSVSVSCWGTCSSWTRICRGWCSWLRSRRSC